MEAATPPAGAGGSPEHAITEDLFDKARSDAACVRPCRGGRAVAWALPRNRAACAAAALVLHCAPRARALAGARAVR